MIRLKINKGKTLRNLKPGDIVHLKITSIDNPRPGWWVWEVDNVTPISGAVRLYGCGICGLCEEALEDGSLPEGWTQRDFEQGHMFICSSGRCQEAPSCRVCGCTEEFACEGGCSWVEPDLCSECAP